MYDDNSGKIRHRAIQGEESKWLKDFKYYPGKVEYWGHCQKCGKQKYKPFGEGKC